MKSMFVVFVKEVLENLRDRRTVINSLVMGPLLGPLLFTALTSTMIQRELDKGEKPLEVPMIGVEQAPNLVEFLKQHGVKPKPAIDNPEQKIREQDVDLVLRIPAGYGEAWRKGEPAQVEMLFDASQ